MELSRAARAVLIGGAVLGLVVGVAGCNGSSPDATPTPTATPAPVVSPSVMSPSVSAAPSVSPSASPSVSPAGLSDEELLEILPAGAEHTDLQGALATASYYAELLGIIFESGDTAVWDALATDECDYCHGQVEAIADFYASGWTAEGGHTTINQIETRGNLGDDGYAYVQIVVDIDDLYAIGEGGVRTNVEPSDTLELVFQMRPDESLWRVNGVQTESRS